MVQVHGVAVRMFEEKRKNGCPWPICKFLREGAAMNARRVAVNDRGAVVGQDHWRAKLTDHEVELMRQMHEQGWGYRRLAVKFDVSRSHVRSIVQFRCRAQTSVAVKVVAAR